MKFSVAWLEELCGVEFAVDDLAERLTAAGLEVASVTPVAADFSAVVVARIIATRPHPSAERLQICDVDDGSAEHLQIVCGAPNARAGLLAPLARVGAVLPGGVQIKQARLRGEPSFGMLCSASELQLDEAASGLMELGTDAQPGASLVDALGLNDHVIDIDLTPNRADCLSMHGLLREVAALYGLTVPAPAAPNVTVSSDAVVNCSVAQSGDCPRYALRVITGIDNQAEIPVWMTERLRRAGMRSKSPVVDVTNYVLLEYGQPLHAFDLDRLPANAGQNPSLQVRRARPGEAIELLNGNQVDLDESFLLITAADQPEALAGVMGGAESAVDSGSNRVVLESAWFAPKAIIGKTRTLGISSEAAHRFERGIDPGIQLAALERASELLLQIAGGAAGPVTMVESPQHLPQPPIISLRSGRVAKLLGVRIADEQIETLLGSLGMRLEGQTGNDQVGNDQAGTRIWQVQPPAARLDLHLEIDLIEEIARLYGYDNMPARAPGGGLPMTALPEAAISLRRLQYLCVDLGYQEVINYSFMHASQLQACYPQQQPIALSNPLTSDLSHMRNSLIPGLLQSLQHNLKHKHGRYKNAVRLFESGTVFRAHDEHAQQSDTEQEQQYLALLATGAAMPEQWGVPSKALDFFDFKGDIEHLCALNANDFVYCRCASYAFLHPGQAAEIILQGHDREAVVGCLGRLHPRLCQQLELPGNSFVAELHIPRLTASLLPNATNISKYPIIRRDLALLVPISMSAQELVSAVYEMGGELLQKVQIFDVYQGTGIESHHKSLAISLILQDSYTTLTDESADNMIAGLLRRLHEQHHVHLRQ